MKTLPCFASLSASEIAAGRAKLIGSAQKVGRGAFLQHGSIPIRHHLDLLQVGTATHVDISFTMTSLADLFASAGLPLPDIQSLADRLKQSFCEEFGVEFTPSETVGLPDWPRVHALDREVFASDAWTFRR